MALEANKNEEYQFGGILQTGVLKNFQKFTGKYLHWSLFPVKL